MLKQKRIMYSILIFLIVGVSNLFGQERVLEKVNDNLYSYTLYDNGKVEQRGYYKELDGTLIVHGIWKNNHGTTALFEDGKMLWIKPKGRKKYTSDEIQLHRLKRKVEMLEQKLTSL
jgi:hypothetical protein